MIFFRSLFLLAAASIAVADQVIWSHGKLADGWEDVSDNGTDTDFKGDTIVVGSNAFFSFQIANPKINMNNFSGYRFDFKLDQDTLPSVRTFLFIFLNAQSLHSCSCRVSSPFRCCHRTRPDRGYFIQSPSLSRLVSLKAEDLPPSTSTSIVY